MREPAVIILHPSAPPVVLHDPRDPMAETVPVLLLADEPDEDADTRLAIGEGLRGLIQQYGAKRVMRWVRFQAHLLGEEV